MYVQLQGVSGTAAYYSGCGIFDNAYQGVYTDLHRNAWTADRYAANEKISYPALTTGSSSSLQSNEFFYSKNNYMRLKNVVLGYTLPKRWSNMPLTQQFAGYALVVSFLLQIVTGLLPDFRIIAWLLQFYIVYVVWEGVPILMGVEEKQRLKYTLLSSVLLILCPAVIQIVFNRLTAILN